MLYNNIRLDCVLRVGLHIELPFIYAYNNYYYM